MGTILLWYVLDWILKEADRAVDSRRTRTKSIMVGIGIDGALGLRTPRSVGLREMASNTYESARDRFEEFKTKRKSHRACIQSTMTTLLIGL